MASELEAGLPDGFVERLQERVYGQCLTVYFISRIDQIHFKLFAAVDQKNPYSVSHHLDDLRHLSPTKNEIEDAARWVVIQDSSVEFHRSLSDLLQEEGYDII